MGFSERLKKTFSKKASVFDKVSLMQTRPLPIPGAIKEKAYIQFIATRNAHGRWNFHSKTNIFNSVRNTKPYQNSIKAFKRAFIKNAGKDNVVGYGNKLNSVNLDTALLILRELEEAHFKKSFKDAPLKEPADHYTSVWRVIPEEFKSGLEDLYKKRCLEKDIFSPEKNEEYQEIIKKIGKNTPPDIKG